MNNPYRRTVLSAALDWHAINAMANKLTPLTLRDAALTIILAAEIHKDPVMVRKAAWRAYKQMIGSDRDQVLIAVKSRRPLEFAKSLLLEYENAGR